ncbi:hypothetical protein Bhyg_07972 [Pseudolycoriella hygida]|uniref:Uncharacterized protein n=1 Tax=Pseudolycoriella hygida TaxID=35572 RepID=A0A9Q0N4M7_9DIPT|nr:hypothetical protein Bhyg_07972 [Pseudolycoriella hygida]
MAIMPHDSVIFCGTGVCYQKKQNRVIMVESLRLKKCATEPRKM